MASRLFAVDLDLGLNKAKQFVFEDFSSDPTSATGRVYFNTSGTPRLKVYTGSAWKSLAYTDDVIAGTTYAISAETATGGANLRLTGSDASTDDVAIIGSGAVSIARTDANTITVTGTDTNTTYDLTTTGTSTVSVNLVPSSGSTDTFTITGSGATTVSHSAGAITIDSTNTTYSAATSSTLGLVKLFSDTAQTTGAEAVSSTANRTYGIQVDSNGKLVVNVPWSDTDTNTTYTAGDGLSLAGTTFSLDTPGTITTSSTNAVTADSHTHEIQSAGLSGTGAISITNSPEILGSTAAVISVATADGTTAGIVSTTTQTFAGDKTFADDVIITGDLTVNGNTTTLNTATLSVEDNIVILNSGVTGTPALNAGLEVERGNYTNATLFWNETANAWYVGTVADDTSAVVEKAIARKYAESINTTGGSAYTVTHNLGTEDVIVQTFVGGSQVECDIDITSANAITVTTNASTNSVKVVVIG